VKNEVKVIVAYLYRIVPIGTIVVSPLMNIQTFLMKEKQDSILVLFQGRLMTIAEKNEIIENN
jgi:hypothetical protein